LRFLVDTNVISELRKGERCDPGVRAWHSELEESEEIFLSVLTIGELRKGIELIRRRDPRSAQVLEAWLSEMVTAYSGRILDVDREIAEEWGRLSVPDPLPVIDGLLAATAKVQGMTLVTRNVKDMPSAVVPCLNPFSS
jgi:predicted nucleic acid-binding protein